MIEHTVNFPLHRNKPLTIKSGFHLKANQNAPYLEELKLFYLFAYKPCLLFLNQHDMHEGFTRCQKQSSVCVCVCLCAAGE